MMMSSSVNLEILIRSLAAKVESLETDSVSPTTYEELDNWLSNNPSHAVEVFERASQFLGVGFHKHLAEVQVSEDFVKKIPIELARDKCFVGFSSEQNRMPMALGSFSSLVQVDIAARLFGFRVEPFFALPAEIRAAINQAYEQRSSQTVASIESLDSKEALQNLTRGAREDLLDSSGRSPIVTLVNSILFDAAQSRASDIHLQPFEKELQVRFRIDGVLFDQFSIPKASQEEVLSRLKVIGEMNIAEKRLPQDGRASVKIGDRLIDLRIASLPTAYGERIVIRLLDKSARLYSLAELGMPPTILKRFQGLIQREHGLILVTGPTGGGKSTTLYGSLQQINNGEKNVVTLEDPIEYELAGISQTQVTGKKGMTFADGLRSVLRQDPDIIMVGEIRDRETAEMAIQSALTGHMVFSTLHTNDAASAVNRLLDLGIEPYLVASSLVAVLAQRLVRRICPECKTEDPNPSSVLAGISEDTSVDAKSFHGKGCPRCRHTGYQGRLGLFELMVIDDDLRSLIQTRANSSTIRDQARRVGMTLLREDGIEKVLDGQTTSEEVIRVSMESE